MTGLVPYLFLAGDAREALSFYRDVFGGELELHTLEDFGRADGPADAVAHGALLGPVPLFAADDPTARLQMSGISFSLLGAAEPSTTAEWFDRLADGGTVLDALQRRPWGDVDGSVIDRYGVTWLLGYSGG